MTDSAPVHRRGKGDTCRVCGDDYPCLDTHFYELENAGGRIMVTHNARECRGDVCSIHKKTEHSMRGFRQEFRGDRYIMERICAHGVGHPDPDDFRILSGEDDGTHGCDGCCA